MKSIRHTLIVYFLVLLTGALTAVSWSSYRTTALALRERQSDSRKMIETQCKAKTEAVRAELDRRILRQAQTMASMRLVTVPYEATHPISAIGAAAMPQGLLDVALWLPYHGTAKPIKDSQPQGSLYVPLSQAQGKYPPTSWDMYRNYPKYTNIESSDALVADADRDHSQEYFQTYRSNGQPMQRSASMGDLWFTLDKDKREKATLFTEDYDDVELKPDLKVRRVTLKTPVSRLGNVSNLWPWRGNGPGPKGSPPKGMGQPPRIGGAEPGTGPPPPRAGGFEAWTVFIQYAGDLGPIEEKIHGYEQERDRQLANLESTIEQSLAQLRDRMFWISLGTLIAIWLGGYAVIRLGLAPLSKMYEAVSQVSATNFHLPLDPDALPWELQPIAARMEEMLEELRKAFAREKQAAADISHELRTPLAALMTTLEVGLRKTRTSAEYRDILDECRSSGQHMYQLVERLLTLARLDAGADQYRPSDVDVIETALNCADLIRPLARARGLELRLNLPDPITMRTDANKVREVLVNLLHNAVEYNKPGGAIDLAIERVNGQVRLEVRDTGIGIKPELLQHIFERFYRADPSRHADTPHAGLGLAIVKSYVDLMAGTIRVESTDAGTAFIVELPFVDAALATAVQATPMLVQR